MRATDYADFHGSAAILQVYRCESVKFMALCHDLPALLDCLEWYAQVAPCHLLWLRDTQHAEHRGRDIAQRSARLQREFLFILRDYNKWHRVRRVGGVRATGHGIDHQLGVAMIGRNQQCATL